MNSGMPTPMSVDNEKVGVVKIGCASVMVQCFTVDQAALRRPQQAAER